MRRYSGEPIPQALLDRILEAGLRSASGRSRRPWELIVVHDRAMLDDLAECREQGAAMLAGADAAIVVVADPTLADTWVEDCSIVMSMKTLADKADLPYETVKHLMAGKIGRPSFISILKIANALECSLDDLAGRNNPALEALRRLADHADGMYQIFAEVEHLLYPNFMMQRENNK